MKAHVVAIELNCDLGDAISTKQRADREISEVFAKKHLQAINTLEYKAGLLYQKFIFSESFLNEYSALHAYL